MGSENVPLEERSRTSQLPMVELKVVLVVGEEVGERGLMVNNDGFVEGCRTGLEQRMKKELCVS